MPRNVDRKSTSFAPAILTCFEGGAFRPFQVIDYHPISVINSLQSIMFFRLEDPLYRYARVAKLLEKEFYE